jgi:hypothetical protein
VLYLAVLLGGVLLVDSCVDLALRLSPFGQFEEVMMFSGPHQRPVFKGQQDDVSVVEDVFIMLGSRGDGDGEGVTVLAQP